MFPITSDMNIHLAITGGKLGTDDTSPPDRLLQPRIQMEMSHSFGVMLIGPTRLVFEGIQSSGLHPNQIRPVTLDQ